MKLRCTAAALALLVLAVPALAQHEHGAKPAATPAATPAAPAATSAAPAGGPSPAEMEAWQKSMTPGPQHEALAKLAGDWTFTNTMWMAPGQPPTESTGTMHAETTMGGRYVVEDWKGEMMGQPFEGHGTNAYNKDILLSGSSQRASAGDTLRSLALRLRTFSQVWSLHSYERQHRLHQLFP